MVDLTFTKGAKSAGVYSDNVSEEYANKLISLTLATTETNQSSGSKPTKIVDLLRITHQFVIKAYLTEEDAKTAKQIKDDLISIATGAETDGGEVTMTYDGDSFDGYIEKIVCIKEADDSVNETSKQVRKYSLTINFIVGVSATSS